MTTQKIKSGRMPGIDADTFVAPIGTLFFNEDQGDLRLGDGVTAGGIPLAVGGGGGGGNYVLPTASTTTKGGVKIDGTTITIANQVISVGTVPYSSLSGTPTIPTNNNQLSNGAGYITSSSLTWSNITSKPTFSTVATSGSYTDLTDKPTIPTNTNQLTNGAGFITSSALTGYATETYVTSRGYLTSVTWNDITGKPTLFSGSYTDLTNKPTIPSDISQLTDTQGLLGQGGGGGGTTYITNNVENPYTFSVAGDDSTLREISNGETLRFAGVTGISITTDAEGKVTITGPDLSSYATQSYVTGQGYITSSALTGYATETYVTSRGYITSSALTGYATETYVTTRGYLTSVDWSIITSKPSFATVATSGSYTDLTNKPTLFSGNYTDLTNKPTLFSGSYNDLTDKPSLAGTYSFSVAADDSSLKEILSGESIKFSGASGITTSSDAEGNITITGPDLSSYATQSYVTGQGYITSSALTGYATETYVTSRGYLTSVDWSIITSKPSFASVATSGSYTDLTNKPFIPSKVSDITNDTGFITSSALTGYATESYVTGQGYITSSALIGYALLTDVPSIGNVTFTDSTISSTDSSSLTFIPSVYFNSDITVGNELIVVNGIKNNLGEIYATENFVEQAVNDLIGAAPAALDTLKELADALGNDNNFATTILNALNNRVRFDTDSQGLTEQQKSNARTNIGAASTTQLNTAVIDLQAEMYAAAVAMG